MEASTTYEFSIGYDMMGGWTIIGYGFSAVVNTIDFYFGVDDDPQHAEDGMTWREWVNTEYNTHKLEIKGNYVVIGEATLTYRDVPVNPDDTIIADNWDGTGIHTLSYGFLE